MKSNIILLIVGLSILIISYIISIIFKQKSTHNKFEYHKKKGKYNEKKYIDSKIENEIILEKIKRLEQEVLQLKQENNILAQEYKKNNILLNENKLKNSSFKPILNYNLFKEKNNTIIDLYKKGKSKEEIAKTLNKSIREIEMVIRLVK